MDPPVFGKASVASISPHKGLRHDVRSQMIISTFYQFVSRQTLESNKCQPTFWGPLPGEAGTQDELGEKHGM